MQGMLRAATPVPKLCIVDLDKTVWSCFDAADTLPPYRRVSECEVRDASGRSIRIHAETPQMLQALRASACRLGIASLNPNHERCCKILAALGLLNLFETDLIKVPLDTRTKLVFGVFIRGSWRNVFCALCFVFCVLWFVRYSLAFRWWQSEVLSYSGVELLGC